MTDSVWLRKPRSRRENPPLSVERITAEAVALLDEEGPDRLTMRRLAERLGTGSTTLYWHVRTKDDVLDLALDEIFGDVPVPARTGDWRADATAMLGGWRAAMLRHPWSAALLGRPLLGPNVLARTEFLYATLAGAGFTGPHLVATAYALSHYVIGSTLMQAGTGDDLRDTVDAMLRERRDRYPSLAEHGHTSGHDWDEVFARGLAYLLDGMAPHAAPGAG
ncbi:TetR/AcrR family transcriptional regulator [Actinomadura kijaniata]|uniref:TetR/AcrR family transcriptional regulator n=1 Tax=Actinomadura kijaniata TaxID=46161 RepID=UPI003F1C5A69